MGSQNEPCAVSQRILDSRERFTDASIVHDPSVFHGHVEIDAHEDAVVVEWQIADRKLRHYGILNVAIPCARQGPDALATASKACPKRSRGDAGATKP